MRTQPADRGPPRWMIGCGVAFLLIGLGPYATAPMDSPNPPPVGFAAGGPLSEGSNGSATVSPAGGPDRTSYAAASCSAPASILMPGTVPSNSLGVGDGLGVEYELQMLGGTGSTTAYLPRIFAFFPLANGQSWQMSVAPLSLKVPSGSWTSGASASAHSTVTSPVLFASGGTALLTSELLGVMSTTTQYEGPQLEVRWHWAVTHPSGTTFGPWVQNTDDAGCSSQFWPAPYVALNGQSGTSGPPGSTYTAHISGYVTGQDFFLELETPTGNVVYSAWANVSGSARPPVPVSIAYDCWCGPLSPGGYLVHFHNVMGSLLYSESVEVTTADGLSTAPTASPSEGPAPLTVAFQAGARGGHPPYQYAWSFGDGTQTTVADPSHTFEHPNTYTSDLTVTDASGISTSASVLITVTQGSPALGVQLSVNATSGEVPFAVSFRAVATAGDPPYEFTWAVGDGTTGIGPSPFVHTYLTPGNQTAVVTVRDRSGSEANDSVQIRPYAPLRVTLVANESTVESGGSFSVLAHVQGGDGGTTFQWSVDGRPLNETAPNLSVRATSTGIESVAVEVADLHGDQASANATVAVTAGPNAPPPGGGAHAPPRSGWMGNPRLLAGALSIGVGGSVLALVIWVWQRSQAPRRRLPLERSLR